MRNSLILLSLTADSPMLLAYLHPGDLPIEFFIIAPLILLAMCVALVVAVVAILKAIDRRAERRKTVASESPLDSKVSSD